MSNHVIFPKPIFSSQDILIEDFIEDSESVSDFAKKDIKEVNKRIA
jgi:hypothetical protein